MSDNFSQDLRDFARKTKQSLDATCRGVTIKWFSSTVQSTPVDTGRLRGNWIVSADAPVVSELARLDKTGRIVNSEITLTVKGVGHVNYMTNNLSYAQKIEYGGSNQAPAGMVRINHARIRTIIAEVAARNQV